MALFINGVKPADAAVAIGYGSLVGDMPKRELISDADCLQLICSDKPLSDKEMAWMYQHPCFDALSRAVQKAYGNGYSFESIYAYALDQLGQLDYEALAEIGEDQAQSFNAAASKADEQREALVAGSSDQGEADRQWAISKMAIALIKAEDAALLKAHKAALAAAA